MNDNGAIILLSGGLDSTTTLFMAKRRGFTLHALSFQYGQRHSLELESAKKVALLAGCESHTVVTLDPGLFRGTALVDRSIDVPRNREMDSSIPVTYVPARNILFLSHALALGESLGVSRIFIGANALDYSGYPDCRPEFIESFERMANLGTRMGDEGVSIRIEAPLIRMSKADIIRAGMELGVDYSLTLSCYDPGEHGEPCGACDSCLLRAKGFREAGIPDPALNRTR